MNFDIKTTASTALHPHFSFTKSNRNNNAADAYIFIRLQESQAGNIHAHILGWSYKQDVYRYLKDSPEYGFLQTVSLRMLKQAGVLYPIAHLELMRGAVG